MTKRHTGGSQDGGPFAKKGSSAGDGNRPPASRPGTSSGSSAPSSSRKKASFDGPRAFYDTITAADVAQNHQGHQIPSLTLNLFGQRNGAVAPRPGTSSGAATTKKISIDVARPSLDSILPSRSFGSLVPLHRPVNSLRSRSPLSGNRISQASTAVEPWTAVETSNTGPEKLPLPERSKSTTHLTESQGARRKQGIQEPLADTRLLIPGSHRRKASTASVSSTTPYAEMLAQSYGRDNRPGNMYSAGAFSGAPMVPAVPSPLSPTLDTITYQHIQEMSSKRISTLDYLRKAHEGRVYWFNTLLFNKPDLARMSYFDSRKLGRRATNYLLLGLSIPTVLDLNSSNPMDYLRTLNALLAEFETFQQIHPPDGSTSSSLSRARIPQMFKRSAVSSSKGRRSSSAADIGLPMGHEQADSKAMNGGLSSSATSTIASFQTTDTDLLPGEEYTYLITPSLPFDPDFYEVFATLCDVLIDCYTRLMGLIPSPKECSPHIADLFSKADARIRKIIVQGVVKEFEDTSRQGVRSEVAGVGKVVLGGLM